MSRPSAPLLTRRAFGQLGAGTLLFSAMPSWARPGEGPRAVADSTFASVLALDGHTWAVVSKPLDGGYETLCNGGILAGEDRVLAFDSYASAAGAEWVIAQSRALTGRTPTDLVLSHHHGDHVGGLSTFAASPSPPRLWLTEAIRGRVAPGQLGAAKEMLQAARALDPGTPADVDLGGRSVRLTAFSGHTASDVVARVEDSVTFFGDLLWQGLFPNYRDARPMTLKRTIATLLGSPTAIAVPGHGSLPGAADLERYRDLLDEIETTALAAYEAGKSPAEAADGYRLPASLGEWTLFNPRYFEVAFGAWYKELEDA